MLELLSIVVFAGHLLATNVASAGPFVCLWLQWRESRSGEAFYGRVGRRLARASIAALVIATLLGGIALGLVWLTRADSFFGAAGELPTSRYWFGGAEWFFYVGCLWAYQRWWPERPAATRSRQFWLRGLLAVMAGTDLVYHFPPLFAVISMLGTQPAVAEPSARFSTLMLRGEVVAFVLHYLIASSAVTGALLMAVARRPAWAESPGESHRLAMWGARLALAATLTQLLSGVYLLVETPTLVRERMLGGDPATTIAFALSLVAMVGLLHFLAAIAFGETSSRETRMAILLMGAVVLLMTGAHHAARQGIYERTESAYVDEQATWTEMNHGFHG